MEHQVDETLNRAAAPSQAAPDATGASSDPKNPNDANGGKSSDPQGAKKQRTIREALDGAKLEQPKADGAEGDGDAAEDSPTHQTAEPGDPAGAGATKDERGTQAPTTGDDSTDALFHKRPEWSELTKVLGEDEAKKVRPILRKVLERETHLTRQVQALQPSAEVVTELRELTGDDEGFKTMRNIVRSYATEPATAIPILEQMLEDARQRAGFTLVSDDLKQRAAAIDKRVTDGELDPEEADTLKQTLLEAEKARAGKKQAETRLQEREKQISTAGEREASLAMANALNSWEKSIVERDPDFGAVTDDSDPDHGRSVADQVFDALRLKRLSSPNCTTEQLVTEAQRAYKLAKGRIGGGGARREQRPVLSQGSSITAKPKPKTMREAMDQVPLKMP